MPKGATDPNGTACEAWAKGVSRRAIQKARKKLLDQTEKAVEQAKPAQLVMPTVVPEEAWPEERRIDPLASAQRAGAIEEAIAIEVKKAIQSGNIPLVKVLTSAWSDVCKCVGQLEHLAEERIKDLKWRRKHREWLTLHYDEALRFYGPAYVRSFFPSKSEENQSCTEPMLEEEADRALKWNQENNGGEPPEDLSKWVG